MAAAAACAAGAGAGAKRPHGAGSKRKLETKAEHPRVVKERKIELRERQLKARLRKKTERVIPSEEQKAKFRLRSQYKEVHARECVKWEEMRRQDRHAELESIELCARNAAWHDIPYWKQHRAKTLWYSHVVILFNNYAHVMGDARMWIIVAGYIAPYPIGDPSSHSNWLKSFSVPRLFDSYERMYSPLVRFCDAYLADQARLETELAAAESILTTTLEETTASIHASHAETPDHYGVPELKDKKHLYVVIRKDAQTLDEDPFRVEVNDDNATYVRIIIDGPTVAGFMTMHENGVRNAGEASFGYFFNNMFAQRISDNLEDPPRETDYIVSLVDP